MEKLYIVVRADLPPGLQLSQAVHAGQEWVLRRGDRARAWAASSNTVVVVTVRDSSELHAIALRARREGVDLVEFHDPDLATPFTSIALDPGNGARRVCRGLPLAFAPARAQGAACVRAREAEGSRL